MKKDSLITSLRHPKWEHEYIDKVHRPIFPDNMKEIWCWVLSFFGIIFSVGGLIAVCLVIQHFVDSPENLLKRLSPQIEQAMSEKGYQIVPGTDMQNLVNACRSQQEMSVPVTGLDTTYTASEAVMNCVIQRGNVSIIVVPLEAK